MRRVTIRPNRGSNNPGAAGAVAAEAADDGTPAVDPITIVLPQRRRPNRAPRRSLDVRSATSADALRAYSQALCRHVRARLQRQPTPVDTSQLDASVPLSDCCRRLKLGARAQEGLFVIAALELDPSLQALLDEQRVDSLTPAALIRLLDVPSDEVDPFRRCFGAEGELVAAGLIEHAADGSLSPSARLMGFLDGVIAFDPALREVASFVLIKEAHGIDDSDGLRLTASGLLADQPVLVTGAIGSGRIRFTAEAARRAGFSGLLVVDATRVKDVGTWARLHKEATLLNAVLALQFVDELGATEADCARSLSPAFVGPAALALIATRGDFRLERLAIGLRVQVASPSAAARRALWKQALFERGVSMSEEAITQLSYAHPLGPSAIAATIDIAVAQARFDGGVTLAHFEKAARAQSPDTLGRYARRIDTSIPLDGLVLPTELQVEMDELLLAARTRPRLHDSCGLEEAGLVALFSGPPGCGKTHAAKVVARELARPLYRIDVTSIVDRFVGETEKHLAQLFSEAAGSNAILLFDEADSLFARRVSVKDAQDRYANMQVNVLLSLIDDYRGFVILTTNLNGSLDDAFARRIPYKLAFTKPEMNERLALWQRLLPPRLPLAADVDLGSIARDFDLTGALIKNAIYRAAAAVVEGGAVSDAMLRHAIFREMASDGRLVKQLPAARR